MPIFLIIFIIGELIFLILPLNLSSLWCLGGMIALSILNVLTKANGAQRLNVLTGKLRTALLLISIMLYFCHIFLGPTELPAGLDNQVITLKGRIEAPIQQEKYLTKFSFYNQYYRLQLSAYGKTPAIAIGQEILIRAKVKRFTNYQNPGSAWYREKQLAAGYSGKGYVKQWLAVSHYSNLTWIEQIRHSVSYQIQQLYGNKSSCAFMRSVLIGQKDQLKPQEVALFQRTGTSHLMAISGLHIGLISIISFYLGQFIWRLIPSACLWMAAQRIGAVAALLSGLVYAELSGMSTSTLRAVIMSSVFLVGVLLNKRTTTYYSLLLALCLVLLLQPYSPFLIGFYLSFLVVAILLSFYQPGKLSFISLQLKIWVILLPLGMYFFGYYPISSIIANLIAIPIFSFLLLPMAVASVLTSYVSFKIASVLATVTDFVFDVLHTLLIWFAKFPVLINTGYFNQLSTVIFITAAIFIFCYLLFIKKTAWIDVRKYGAVLMAFIFVIEFLQVTSIPQNEAKMHVLDVGQGLSVVVRTANHLLVYDVGDKYPSGFNLGDAVVLPYLRTLTASKIDKLIISHQDSDHSGGLAAVVKQMSVGELISNYSSSKNNWQHCHETKSWQWDGVVFYFLQPEYISNLSENNRSCVLVIENQYQRIILPGDIEKKIEIKYISKLKKDRKSTILISPHHGSKTSSSLRFLKTISPDAVIISSGKNNRYHFPHKKIIDRYSAMGAQIYNTATCGMSSWHMTKSLNIKPVQCYHH